MFTLCLGLKEQRTKPNRIESFLFDTRPFLDLWSRIIPSGFKLNRSQREITFQERQKIMIMPS